MNRRLEFYTDATVQRRKTVVGFIVKDRNDVIYQEIISASTQNVNKAELIAVRESLYLAKQKALSGFTIFSDSMYVVEGAKNENKENKREWEKVKEMLKSQNATIEWVKAHDVSKGNVHVDKMIK